MNNNLNTTATTVGRNGFSKKAKLVRHHIRISVEDLNWAQSQKSCVQQLWLDCCATEQFGKQMRKLETNLSDKSFRIAKAALEKQGLFKFEPIVQLSSSGRTKVIGWKVENLHGYYYQRIQERQELREEDYQQFLSSKYWKKVRKLVLKRDNFYCQFCGSDNNLNVHHLTYKHHGDEMNHLEDLITLCAACHKIEHNKSS